MFFAFWHLEMDFCILSLVTFGRKSEKVHQKLVEMAKKDQTKGKTFSRNGSRQKFRHDFNIEEKF